LIEIVVFDAFGKLDLEQCKRAQTRLAEASIAETLAIAQAEAAKRFGPQIVDAELAVLALGKLGSGGMDYDSDLDLVFVHDNEAPKSSKTTESGNRMSVTEYHSRVIEIFTTVLSSITRDGSLYRVDLRLRPHGSDGPLVISRKGIVEYFQTDAAVWELLAYVKLRAVGGEMDFANSIENELRDTIHKRALTVEPIVLAAETRAVRDKLEKQKAKPRSNEIDIKFGPGGLLDIYFAVRYLQLRFGIRDGEIGRATGVAIENLNNLPSLTHLVAFLNTFSEGYKFLYALDHYLRKTLGRRSSVVLSKISGFEAELPERLALTMIEVRTAFDHVLLESRQ
jgi:glutamate-ammonia-ligase adenylyltransferase